MIVSRIFCLETPCHTDAAALHNRQFSRAKKPVETEAIDEKLTLIFYKK